MRLESHAPAECQCVLNKLSAIVTFGTGQKPRPLESKDFSDLVKSWLDKSTTKLSLPFSPFFVGRFLRLKRLFRVFFLFLAHVIGVTAAALLSPKH